MEAKDWYADWFDENYLLLYRHRDSQDALAQSELIIKTVQPAQHEHLLDLACGEGRHSYWFAQKGFSVTGLDLSTPLLELARKNYPQLRFIQSDMRSIPGQYHGIMSLFTSFGYFADHKDNAKVIQAISAALFPQGWFWLDFFNAERVKHTYVPRSEKHVPPDIRVIEKRKIEGNFIVKEIEFYRQETLENTYLERVWLYSKEELTDLLEQHGILVQQIFGDYAGNDWQSDSPRTIVYGRKAAKI